MKRRDAIAILVGLASCVVVAVSSTSHALRAARPYRLELLGAPRDPLGDEASSPNAPLPTISPDGALVVTARVASRAGNRDPGAVRVTGARGVVQTRVEEIAPGLFRIAPRRRFAPGTLELSGLDVRRVRVARGGAAPPAPAIAAVTNHRTPLDATRPSGAANERVSVTLREPAPPGAVALVARWVDWHDTEGGLYGAWTTLAPGVSGELALICTAGSSCGDVHGHIPRENERGELRWVDSAGRLSPPVTITVTTTR
jgi:hypothetical protein